MMHVKKFKKKMLMFKRYPYKTIEECPQEQMTDFLYYLVRKIGRDEGDTNDFVMFLRGVGELPSDFTLD